MSVKKTQIKTLWKSKNDETLQIVLSKDEWNGLSMDVISPSGNVYTIDDDFDLLPLDACREIGYVEKPDSIELKQLSVGYRCIKAITQNLEEIAFDVELDVDECEKLKERVFDGLSNVKYHIGINK